ncbi:uncharacterized protein N7458_004669 [Penicillium daleae]|uniref:Tautomerase cis-CaaD-like domain-containing protein n=1 Tax=Penicillium daleae TaxID=63821 RepID=A0AAD6G360_9EURO|nr:uncharacterized protein N7458_004669 [Penicillium daleae]KAJ5453713.1 hypothetical protein N7458_004669 [Penicillium daleae]
MPVWLVYHHPSQFSTEESCSALARDITTKVYNMIPPFYTQVVFQPTASIYVGGEHNEKMVRFVIHELAGQHHGHVYRAKWVNRVNRVLAPHIAEKGLDWEFHIEEPSRDLWSIRGLEPPPLGSKAEAEWIRRNQPVPYKL